MSTAPPIREPVPEPRKVRPVAKTLYVVLRLASKDGCWQPDGLQQQAASAQGAIRQAVELRGENDVDQEGEYVAIPARSWQPVSVTVSQTTVVKLGDA
jgi:hypothetical protein